MMTSKSLQPFVNLYKVGLIKFLKMGQSRPLFVYFRPILNTIPIIQIEKGCFGFEPTATGW